MSTILVRETILERDLRELRMNLITEILLYFIVKLCYLPAGGRNQKKCLDKQHPIMRNRRRHRGCRDHRSTVNINLYVCVGQLKEKYILFAKTLVMLSIY